MPIMTLKGLMLFIIERSWIFGPLVIAFRASLEQLPRDDSSLYSTSLLDYGDWFGGNWLPGFLLACLFLGQVQPLRVRGRAGGGDLALLSGKVHNTCEVIIAQDRAVQRLCSRAGGWVGRSL